MFGFKHRREFYVPKGAMKFADRESSAVVYAYERAGTLCLMGFHGRAQKPDFHYRYPNRQAREEKAKGFFKSVRASEAFRIQQRKERQQGERGLQVGDILRCSWGYEQTNIDYYQVTALIGQTMVEIREIAARARECDGWLRGKCVPMPGQFVGEPMRKRALKGAVSLTSYSSAYLMKPEVVGGVPIYQPDSYTAYH